MHTKGLTARGSNIQVSGRCIGVAYGWNEEPIYDADGKMINDLTSTDEALANARLWAAADEMVDALKAARAALTQCNHIPGVTEQAILAIDDALSSAGIA